MFGDQTEFLSFISQRRILIFDLRFLLRNLSAEVIALVPQILRFLVDLMLIGDASFFVLQRTFVFFQTKQVRSGELARKKSFRLTYALIL